MKERRPFVIAVSSNYNNSNNRQVFLIGFLCGLLCLSFAGRSSAAEETPAAPVEPAATTPISEGPSTAEIVAAIKHRAEQILEERRKARQLQFSGDITQAIAYERNPSNAANHKGDTYEETDLSLYLSKKLTPTITWQALYYGSYDAYFRYTDGTYTNHTLTPVKLLWRPGRMWRVDSAVDLTYLGYPDSRPSTYDEIKPSIGVRQNLWGTWYQGARYEWLYRYYPSKKAQDGITGTDTRFNRQDTRHRLRYELGTTWLDTLIKVRNDWIFHDSNDQNQDQYDSTSYRVNAALYRPITQKLSANFNYSYELKRLRHKPVGNVTPDRSRHDEIESWTLAGIYDLNNTWSVSPSYTYSHLNSTDPLYEYFDWTAQVSVTARF